jgi:YebC/PmpR family DNA-binding regulatory protein
MSGHSKWHSIKHKKGIIDAKRGKIFTRHANLITIAARSGGDPSINPTLRLAIENAKKDNTPNTNIERAIKRGTGELKGDAAIEEVIYETYAPGGVAVMIECLTDNKNRTFTNLRTVINKGGGQIAASGSVTYLFERRGVARVPVPPAQRDEVSLLAIDAGADDIQAEDECLVIYSKPGNLSALSDALTKAGFAPANAEVQMSPKTTVAITDEAMAKRVLTLLDAIEDDNDVVNISANFEISDDLII